MTQRILFAIAVLCAIFATAALAADITGDKISFYVQTDMNGSPTKFMSEGTIKGEEITITIKAEGGPDFAPTVLKRAK